MELLTNTERDLIPQIVEKVVNLTSEQQMWILGWMQAKAEENENKLHAPRKRRNNSK